MKTYTANSVHSTYIMKVPSSYNSCIKPHSFKSHVFLWVLCYINNGYVYRDNLSPSQNSQSTLKWLVLAIKGSLIKNYAVVKLWPSRITAGLVLRERTVALYNVWWAWAQNGLSPDLVDPVWKAGEHANST